MSQVLPDFYQHTRRPEWGLAVLAWERDGKRAFLFEGGMLKVLAEPFFALMQPTDSVEDGASIVQRLAKHLEANDAIRTSKRASLPPNASLADQLALLRGEYEGDFSGAAWQEKARGLGQQRRLKRHRNAAIEQAQQALQQGALEAGSKDDRHVELWAALVETLAGTDLAPPKQVELLRGRSGRATPQTIAVLSNLLYGEGAFEESFDGFVKELRRILGVAPSWELATAVLALVHPEVHICVRKSSFLKQAELRLSTINGAGRPNAVGYLSFLELATQVFEELKTLGGTPEDLMDIHDFMKATTNPAALRRIQAVRRTLSRSHVAEAEAEEAEAEAEEVEAEEAEETAETAEAS
jgi:hypothetical protein